jgi:hypothetical protein
MVGKRSIDAAPTVPPLDLQSSSLRLGSIDCLRLSFNVTAQTSVQVFLQEELVKESPNGLTESLIALLSSLTVSKTVLCVRRTSVLASPVSAPRF